MANKSNKKKKGPFHTGPDRPHPDSQDEYRNSSNENAHEDPQKRIEKFEEFFKRKKRNGHQIFWLRYNSNTEYKYDLEDAREDIEWMIAEIKRLQEENNHYREFIDALRHQMEQELK